MASVASQPQTTSIEELEAAGFTLRQPDEVLAALAANPFLVPWLLEAARILPHYFDLTEPVVLGAQYDWYAEEETRILIVRIPIRATFEEARQRLHRFGHAWWDGAPDRVHELLVFDTTRDEPQPVD
jgi:hypothetical protein